MKKNFFEKGLAFGILLVTIIITAHFYKKGEISLLVKEKWQEGYKNSSLGIEIPFLGKEHYLSYKERPASEIIEISRFENTEDWQGDGDFDYSNKIEGKSSLSLNSQDGNEVTAFLDLENTLDPNTFQNFVLFVYLKTPPENIQELTLAFRSPEGEKENKISPENLSADWNLLSFDRVSFLNSGSEEKDLVNKVSGVILKLTARPGTITSVSFDLFFAAKKSMFVNDWNLGNGKPVILAKNKDELNLLMVSGLNRVITAKAVTSVGDFSFQARLTPLKRGPFGLFVRGDFNNGNGYYLILNGVGTNSWEIYTQKDKNKLINRGTINNFQIEENRNYWLKAKTKRENLNFYISLDGQNFVKLGEVNDDSFSSGGVGFTGFGDSVFFVDEIKFFQ